VKNPAVGVPLFLTLVMSLPLARSAETAPSVEERLQALENQVHALAAENLALKRELGWKESVPPVEVQAGANEDRLSVGGFLQAQGEFGRAADPRWNGTNDRFFFRRARIYLAGNVATDFDFKAELDLQGNSLSASTGLNARANEVFINWHKLPYLNLRFGQLKPAFGAEALASDGKIHTIERSLSSDRLADSRQLSVGAAGDLFDKRFSYLAIVANGNGSNVSANDNNRFQKSLRLAYTPIATDLDKVLVGVDGLWTDDVGVSKPDLGLPGNLFTGRRTMRGVDAQWTHGIVDLSAEWLSGKFSPTTATAFTAEGWHVTATCFLVPNKLQAVLREEQFDPNIDMSGNTIRTFTVGLNYFVKGDDLKFMVDYLDGHVPGSLNDGGRLITRMQIIY
jgi:phosphate-selective porin OprO/OprP